MLEFFTIIFFFYTEKKICLAQDRVQATNLVKNKREGEFTIRLFTKHRFIGTLFLFYFSFIL
jgi:hypothetical protein